MKPKLILMILLLSNASANTRKESAAIIINANGYLCATVISIIPFGPNTKRVECIINTDRTGRASYKLNTNSGKVSIIINNEETSF